MKKHEPELGEHLSPERRVDASSPAHLRDKFDEQELERQLLHNAELREDISHKAQVRTIRGGGSNVAACIPIVLLALMYATLIWVKPPAAVMQTLIICTFSSFVVIYGFLLSGWYRGTRFGHPPTLTDDIEEASRKRFRDQADRGQGRGKTETPDRD